MAKYVIEKVTYRCRQLDGSVLLKVCYTCPTQGCAFQNEDLSTISSHVLEEHGVCLDPRSKDHTSAATNTGLTAWPVRLPNGENRILCPLCPRQFLPEDSMALSEHLASQHGRVLAIAANKDAHFDGQSDHLDLLFSVPSSAWFPKRDEALKRMHIISLGSYCGMKFSIQHMGLGCAHLPFDWVRSTSAGVAHFVRERFQEFFSVASQAEVKEANLKMYRSEYHSFWHDDISVEAERKKLQRRIDRFHALDAEPRDLLFMRCCSCTEEILQVEELYQALNERFGASLGSGRPSRRVLLVVVIDGQKEFQGPISHSQNRGIVFYTLAPHGQKEYNFAYCEAISSAVTLALAAPQGCNPALGFVSLGPSNSKPLRACTGHSLHGSVSFWDGGHNSGFADLKSFEQPGSVNSLKFLQD